MPDEVGNAATKLLIKAMPWLGVGLLGYGLGIVTGLAF